VPVFAACLQDEFLDFLQDFIQTLFEDIERKIKLDDVQDKGKQRKINLIPKLTNKLSAIETLQSLSEYLGTLMNEYVEEIA
jgi:hypothetical protein